MCKYLSTLALALGFISFVGLPASAGPDFPAGFDSWKHSGIACENSVFIKSQRPGEIEKGQPDWVYRFLVNRADIAIVTWSGEIMIRLQTLEEGAWLDYDHPDIKLYYSLLRRTKLRNGFVSDELHAECMKNLQQMKNG